jgi:hypothetical protein
MLETGRPDDAGAHRAKRSRAGQLVGLARGQLGERRAHQLDGGGVYLRVECEVARGATSRAHHAAVTGAECGDER